MIGNLHPWVVVEVNRDLNRRRPAVFKIRSHHKTKGAAEEAQRASFTRAGCRVVRLTHLRGCRVIGRWAA